MQLLASKYSSKWSCFVISYAESTAMAIPFLASFHACGERQLRQWGSSARCSPSVMIVTAHAWRAPTNLAATTSSCSQSC
eukprot:2744076-Amphidinium_carterae.1